MDGQPYPCSLVMWLVATGKGLTSAVTSSVSSSTYVWEDEWEDSPEEIVDGGGAQLGADESASIAGAQTPGFANPHRCGGAFSR